MKNYELIGWNDFENRGINKKRPKENMTQKIKYNVAFNKIHFPQSEIHHMKNTFSIIFYFNFCVRFFIFMHKLHEINIFPSPSNQFVNKN